MTNQAAQTIPELPDSQYRGGNDVFGKEFPLYTADQMHQYARDYAAAIAQTAGVADGFVMVPVEPNDAMLSVADEDNGAKITDGRSYAAALWSAMLAAAPAASGGEAWRCFYCDEVFTDRESAHLHFGAGNFLDQKTPGCQIDIAAYRAMEETVRRYQEEDADIHRAMHRMAGEHALALRREEEKGYARGLSDAENEPQPPAAASVSELRRYGFPRPELTRPVQCEDGFWTPWHVAQAALEQALTQQRGQGTTGSMEQAEKATFVPCDCGCGRSCCAMCGNDVGFLTPQPSADAVRELVRRMRKRADELEEDSLEADSIGHATMAAVLDGKSKVLREVADELESLLSSASDHQQNAAQGGGEK